MTKSPSSHTVPCLDSSPEHHVPEYPPRLSLTAGDLPPLMSVPDPRGSYRFPLLQFIWDWNVARDRAALVAEAPSYEGDDQMLLPAISAVVHSLANRDGVSVPNWVLSHRADTDVILFDIPFDSPYGRWLRKRAPSACASHRVWFHPRMLDKGTPDWWLPWD